MQLKTGKHSKLAQFWPKVFWGWNEIYVTCRGGRNRTGEEGVWGMGRPLTDPEPHTHSPTTLCALWGFRATKLWAVRPKPTPLPGYPKVQCGDPRHWVIASAQPPMLHHHLERGQDGRGLGSILGKACVRVCVWKVVMCVSILFMDWINCWAI